jgi:glycosyltransferase involved in cell wall biosynthesis
VTVLYVASITPRKNQLALLKAIPKIVERHGGTRFVFVGPILDTKYYHVLIEFVNKYKLSNLKFTGLVNDEELFSHYRLADIVVLLSYREGLAKTIIEAMTFGKAIVASSIPENQECAKSGDEIVFVNPDDEVEIAEAISSLIDDPEKRKELGIKARRTAVRSFGFDSVYESIISFIETRMTSNRKLPSK